MTGNAASHTDDSLSSLPTHHAALHDQRPR
jgi:hypothetical protein